MRNPKVKPKLLIFASGTKDGGGSGFENLAMATKRGTLKADITGVVSNHAEGGVKRRVKKLKDKEGIDIPFIYFNPDPAKTPQEKEGLRGEYRDIVAASGADFVAFSGWLKLALGLDPRKTINIHPGPLPEFGGKGMYGIHVHEAVIEAYKKGKLKKEGDRWYSHMTMHFVTEEYDRGPVFCRRRVEIFPEDTPLTLQEKVHYLEHRFQPEITNWVVLGKIYWDGKDPKSIRWPDTYKPIA